MRFVAMLAAIFSVSVVAATEARPPDAGAGPDDAARIYTEQPAPGTSLPTQVTPRGVGYVCGGVGAREQAEMKDRVSNYDLLLTFADLHGQYLADVHVQLLDRRGQPVLDIICDAPMMLVNLPRAGTYQVRASTEDGARERRVQVPREGGASVLMHLPSQG